ncbi:MAG: amidohydrolase/deacetylase family metallohydrolase [Candidatus Bathyarchaeia archaeon]
MFDIIVKDGLLIDPSQGIHSERDIAFYAGRVAAVEENMEATPGKDAKHIIDASNRIVTPGLIDIHVHVHQGALGLNPEALLNTGTTTALDAGTFGALTFPLGFRSMANSSTVRLYAFLNISSLGLSDRPELEDITYGDVDKAVRVCQENRDLIKGIKVRLTENALRKSNPLDALRLAREAADKAGLPLMVHGIRTNQTDLLKGVTLPDVLAEMKKGDILTHTFARYTGILGEDGEVIPALREAVKRGVIIDVGHGIGSFSFHVAKRALEQGVQPDTISSDLHKASYMGPVFDLPTTMSKFMHLGLSLDEVVRKVTETPAEALGLGDSLGTLKVGAVADAVIFELERGKFTFTDSFGVKETVNERLVPKVVIRGGEVYLAGTWSQVKWVYYRPTWV